MTSPESLTPLKTASQRGVQAFSTRVWGEPPTRDTFFTEPPAKHHTHSPSGSIIRKRVAPACGCSPLGPTLVPGPEAGANVQRRNPPAPTSAPINAISAPLGCCPPFSP